MCGADPSQRSFVLGHRVRSQECKPCLLTPVMRSSRADAAMQFVEILLLRNGSNIALRSEDAFA